jgi:hypothetical protein
MDALQTDEQLPDNIALEPVRFIDNNRAPAGGAHAAEGQTALNVPELCHRERRGVYLFNVPLPGYFRGQQSGNGALACPGCSAEPERPAGKPALGQRLDTTYYLGLPHYFIPALRSVGFCQLHVSSSQRMVKQHSKINETACEDTRRLADSKRPIARALILQRCFGALSPLFAFKCGAGTDLRRTAER